MTERSNGAPNVLIIDDEAGILDSLRILLKNEGFVPHVALGGDALREGFESIEHVKRYTTTGMATDQGKTSNVPALA